MRSVWTAKLVNAGANSGLQFCQETGNCRTESFNIDQKGIVALRRGQRCKFSFTATSAKTFGNLLLLLQRKQDIRVYADRPGAISAVVPPSWRSAPIATRPSNSVVPW